MLRKTFKKFLKKLENKQLYFIDSSILVEILFKQDYADKCRSFLDSTKSGNKKAVLSNSVMGEVICTLLFKSPEFGDESTMAAFELILELVKSCGCLFVTIDKETINVEREIRAEEGNQLQQLDLLNLATAVRHKGTAFVTLDPDFSQITGKKFGIKIINLKEFVP